MDMFGRNDIQLIANLLTEAEKDRDFKPKISAELNPASLVEGYEKKKENLGDPFPPIDVPKKLSTEIWDEDEVPIEGYVDEADTRITPL